MMDAEDIVAEDLTYSEVLQLEQKEATSPEEAIALSKYYLQDFYGLDRLRVEDVLWDNNGRRRQELVALEVQLARWSQFVAGHEGRSGSVLKVS